MFVACANMKMETDLRLNHSELFRTFLNITERRDRGLILAFFLASWLVVTELADFAQKSTQLL